jgi:GTP-binding protein
VAAQLRARLPTGLLNRTLVEAAERTQPPMVGGRRLRVYYATQVGTAPVALRLFVNDPKLATRPFLDYLVRRVRERFGLEGAPVVLSCRARARPEQAGPRRTSEGDDAGRAQGAGKRRR